LATEQKNIVVIRDGNWKMLPFFYVPRHFPLASAPEFRRCAPECGARCVPGNADMDEVLGEAPHERLRDARDTIRGARAA